MRKWLWAIAAALPSIAFAQWNIDGVWKTDPKSVVGANKPSRYVVDKGEYRCETCRPKIVVPADGKPHAQPDNPFIGTIAARVVDDRTFEVTSVAGKITTVGKLTISADGKTLTRESTTKEANGTTSHFTDVLARVGPLPKTGHIVSGNWKFTTLVRMSDETLTFKRTSGNLSMNASDGSSYDAPMDGTRVRMLNSPGNDSVSVTQRGVQTFEEVSYSGDTPVWVNVMVVSPDGDSMKITWEDKLRGTKGSFRMTRQ
jgi:hypothetical protein